MATNRFWLGLQMAAWMLAAAMPVQAAETVTLVHPTDPAFEASVWPILTGKVKSDKVDLQISFTSIPAVIQAATTQQYDLVPTVTNILPRLVERGVPIRILSTNMRYAMKGAGSRTWVLSNGPLKSVADLRGKTIGVSNLSSSGVTGARVILSEVYRANVALDGGDFKWVEMPLAVLRTALTTGRVDAAVLSNQYDYEASKNTDFRPLFTEGLNAALKAQVPGTVIMGYEPKLKARPDAFVEANRLLKQSAAYVKAHQDEVFGAVAGKANIDPAYLKWYYENYADIPYDLTKEDLRSIEAFWQAVKKLKMVDATPDLKTLVWERVNVE
jgi:ABC-type nitrate/sulfonate/bicarbonate transport system substrate-binding protein